MEGIKYGCECTCQAHGAMYPADKEIKALRVKRTDGREMDVCAGCFHLGFDELIAAYITDTPEIRAELLKQNHEPERIEQVMAAVKKLAGDGEAYDKLIEADKERVAFFNQIDKDKGPGGYAAKMSIIVGIPWREVKQQYDNYNADPDGFLARVMGPQDDPLERLLNDILVNEPTKVAIH